MSEVQEDSNEVSLVIHNGLDEHAGRPSEESISLENLPPIIDRLPNEILLHVFSFLPIAQLKRNVSLTCRRWYRISKSPSLLEDLYFGPYQSTEKIIVVLQSAPQLKRLYLFSRNDSNDLLREVTSSNLKLVRLKVSSCKEGRHVDLEADTLLECLRTCKNMRYLVLKRVAFDHPELVFHELGAAATQLRGLNLNHSVQLDTPLLHDLVFGLPKLRDFRLYCLSYNRIGSVTPYADTPILEMLTKMGDTLECLKLNMLGLTDGIMPLLSTLPNLLVLHLYRLVNVQDEGFELLSRLDGLRKFVVTVPRSISAECWASLFGSTSFGRLSLITISNSYSLDDTVLRVISANCPELAELNVPGCRRVTDTGLCHIIVNCPRLKKLNLFSTRAVVSQAFIILPEYLPNLELLIYKPVDSNNLNLPAELDEMSNLKVKTTYRYL